MSEHLTAQVTFEHMGQGLPVGFVLRGAKALGALDRQLTLGLDDVVLAQIFGAVAIDTLFERRVLGHLCQGNAAWNFQAHMLQIALRKARL